MAVQKGKCVFGPDHVGLTKQHVWPKWLMKVNQPHVKNHTQVGVGARHDAPNSLHVASKLRQGHSGTRTARKVCKTCNNGWIERLEERIRAPLTQMMVGAEVVLNRELQRDFAAWLTLVTMMGEFLEPKTVSVPAADYIFLFENGEPPPGWKIWIGKYVGDQHDQWVFRHYGMQLADSPDVLTQNPILDTQVTTFVIGQLFAHTFRSTILGSVGFPDYDLHGIPKIWPHHISWPNVPPVNDASVRAVADGIIRNMPPAPK